MEIVGRRVGWRRLGLGLVPLVLAGCAGERVESAPGVTAPPGAAPVVWIVVDTLRADHLGVYGSARPTTPHLDRWAADGRVYETAFATAPWTLPSFGSMFTGRWPMAHRAGVMTDGWFGRPTPARLSEGVETLAEVLGGYGYATGAVMNNPFLDDSFGVARGFDVYDHVPGDNQDVRRADVMVDRALDLVDGWGDRPFFLVLHLFDPHLDYDPPDSTRGAFTDGLDSTLSLPIWQLGAIRDGDLNLGSEDEAFIRAAYDEEVLFVDQQIERFRAGLASRGVLDEALVVLTSDHGEELFDHGGFEHGHAMWQEVIRVPFVVWGPGVAPGREEGPVSLVDLMPTALDWMGLETGAAADGLSLRANLTVGATLPERSLVVGHPLYGPPMTAVVRWPIKMYVDGDDVPLAVVDLAEDPGEARNALEAYPDDIAALSAALREERKLAARARHLAPDEAATPDAEITERLRALGYVR